MPPNYLQPLLAFFIILCVNANAQEKVSFGGEIQTRAFIGGSSARSYTGGKQPWTPEWLAAAGSISPNPSTRRTAPSCPTARTSGCSAEGAGRAKRTGSAYGSV